MVGQVSVYEKVHMNENIPLKIIYLDSKNNEVFPSSMLETEHFIPPHWHRSIEFSLVLDGAMRIYLDEKVLHIKANEFLLVNSSDIHSASNYIHTPCEVIVFLISYDYLKGIYPDIDHIRFDIYKTNIYKERLRDLFLKIKTLNDSHNTFDYMMIHSYVLEIMYILFTYYQENTTASSHQKVDKYQERAKAILTYVHEHYQEPLALSEVAAHFHMSNEHFSRTFHKIYNINYKAYINNYRLYRAYQDVISTNKTLQDIAMLHGFSNVKSFITQFKKIYQMTPSDYRKKFSHINK